MTFIKNIFFSLVYLCCFQQGLSASMVLDFTDCSPIPVDLEQIVITEDGFFILDETNTVLPVYGFFQQEHQMYAMRQSSLLEKHMGPPICGHPLACKDCEGCRIEGCFGHCKCRNKIYF